MMEGDIARRYLPLYPSGDQVAEKDLRSFITNYYRLSDRPEENEQWINSFTKDAQVNIAADKAQGSEEIRELRGRMWSIVKERKHTVLKVFPGQFAASESPHAAETECMLAGEANFSTRDGRTIEATWSAHAVLRKEGGEWKFASYRVWVQTD